MFIRHLGSSALIILSALLTCVLLTLSTPERALAQGTTRLRTPGGGSIAVNAKTASRDYDRGIIELTGDVQIVYDQQYLSCDRAIINLKDQTLEAEGNLVINSPTAYVEGDKAILSYADNTGIIINGFVKSGQVIVEGRIVRKTGEKTYEAETASFTACTTCPTAWSFSGSRIQAEIGGYAHIRNSVFEVANVPVFWLPYLIVPLKSERQTGLLIPSFDYSEAGGAAINLSFFWALSRSQDATLTLKNYAKRGIKPLVNYRYVLSESSYGELTTGWIRDRVFQNDTKLGGDVGPKINRWLFTYDHVYELPYNITQRTRLNYVSDLKYPRDFPDEIYGQGDPALESRVSLSRNTEDTHASMDVSYYLNQLRANPIESNRDAVHRWPELRYSLVERPLWGTGVLFNLKTNYVNFAREDLGWDDVDRDANGFFINRSRTGTGGSSFEPGVDLIRTGQRLDLQPEIAYPFKIGRYLDIAPSLQFRHTQYSFNVNPPTGSSYDATPYRQYLRGTVSARTSFSRVYGRSEASSDAPKISSSNTVNLGRSWVDAESQGLPVEEVDVSKVQRPNLYRHEISPEVTLSGIPQDLSYRSNSEFFGSNTEVPIFLTTQPISDADFIANRGIQFDYHDRITDRNAITLALDNKLVRKSWTAAVPEYKQIARFRIAQSYDFDEAKSRDRATFPWSDISALLDVRLEGIETNTLLQYFPYHNVTNTSSRVKFIDKRNNFFQLSFTQTYLITSRVEEAYPGRQDNIGFSAGFDSRYVTFVGGLDFTPADYGKLDFRQKGWSSQINIKPPGNCWGIRATISRNLADDVMWKLDFDYKFGGEAG